MNIRIFTSAAFILLLFSCDGDKTINITPQLTVSDNGRFLQTRKGDPFFWLGDTGWLLFKKLNREEAAEYLDDRKQKGINVIQAMVIHNVKDAVNIYGDSAILNNDVSQPVVTDGNSPDDPMEYDYWDHVDYIIRQAGTRGIYVALVPVWGSNVRGGNVTRSQAQKYAGWLADRYKDYSNVVWLNGGDVKGSDSTDIWNIIGTEIKSICPGQLMTFHPFGRTQSSEWFHNSSWLDFNMFQSGHRRYDQDTSGLSYGEDNWKYVLDDYTRNPVKPTLDGEPSYEGIPQGLHDPSQPYWTDADVRRYAYWSVFAGSCGFTYGNNAIMQFHREGDIDAAYGVRETWSDALDAPGVSQMIHLKNLMNSKPFTGRIPEQELLAENDGEKYDHIAIIRGDDYVFAYTCNGRNISLKTNVLPWKGYNAKWFDPKTGGYTSIGSFEVSAREEFNPPGPVANGNDRVLILEKK